MDLLMNSFTHVWYILKAILNDIEHSLKYKFKYKKGLFRSKLLIWLFHRKPRAMQLLASALNEMEKNESQFEENHSRSGCDVDDSQLLTFLHVIARR